MSGAKPPPGSLFLIVDDNERLRERLAYALHHRGYRTITADSPATALEAAAAAPTHAILDLRMPGGSGLDLLADLRETLPEIEAVVLTGYGSVATAVEAMRLGAVNFLAKPADADMILAAFAPAQATGLRGEDYTPPSLARAEWELINRVLEDCGGNISRAARKLGLHRRTLQRKLQKYPPRE